MTKPLLVTLPGSEHLTKGMLTKLDAEPASLMLRRFPDDETYLRYDTSPRDRNVVLLCSLDRPDDKVLPLVFAANAARDLGAAVVGLVCPYLAYMRQDRRFRAGEAVTSAYFARVLSREIDWLVTVDPHLHRRGALSEIYSVPAIALHAAPLISDWIRSNIERPLLIGPDAESEQWVAAVARDAGAPHIVLQKNRHGDRDVEISVPDIERWREHTPVLIDDIISTGRTMIETIGHLMRTGMRPAICVGVHGIFAGNSFAELRHSGAAQIVTLNTVRHESNAMDVSGLLAEAGKNMIEEPVSS
jgi:ribose-phosphate pyrophosphokinase